jgi:predicted transposase YbfD/YdcC
MASAPDSTSSRPRDPNSILDHFADLPDPRREQGRIHRLDEIVFIATCAVLCGADNWVQIADYAHSKLDWLETFLELPGGIPSHDTFRRTFCLIDPMAFQECFSSWMAALMARKGLTPIAPAPSELTPIAIDGKAQRGSARRTVGRSALHVVSAWAVENRLTLGQVATDAKSNEITAIPELLGLLDVAGALVTIDAMGCQKEIADLIREGGGDYVLAVKQNQPTLYEQVGQAIDAGLEQDSAALDEHRTVETGHGRRETRTYAIFPAPETVDPDGVWRDLSAVGIAITESTDSQGRERLESRYYILSVLLSAMEFAGAVRGHWGIENNLHWQLDVSFREDECRVRTDHAPANLSVIRRFALGLLKRETTCRRGIETKRLKCAANDEYREKALFNT